MKRWLSTGLLIACVTLVPALGWAGAKQTIEVNQQKITALLKAGGESNEAAVKAAFDDLLDYEGLAKRSLDKHWDSLTPEQRREFTEVLQQLVRRAYRKSLAKILNYDVAYLGESVEGEQTVVKTKASHKTDKRAEPVLIEYRMHKVGDAWLVHDIVTAGVSMVNSYKIQFNRVIKKKGVDGLLDMMKRKLAQG